MASSAKFAARRRAGAPGGPALAVATLALLMPAAAARAEPGVPPSLQQKQDAAKPRVPPSLQQIQDAWLSVDAAVVGTYRGVDSTRGDLYHAIEVKEVWMGSPSPGRLVFKAPRGVDAEPGAEALLMLWDRLNAATDSYIETASRIHGEDAWKRIGPDSLASYLLPFPQYAFPFHRGKIALQGTGPFKSELKRAQLHKELLDFEYTLLPPQLFSGVDVVVYARVVKLDKRSRVIEGVPVEYRIRLDLQLLDAYKGSAPDSLRLEYASFPRSPRFEENEEVILFLTRSGDALFLEQGKRAVYHVLDGSVVETAQPLAEFVKALRAERR